MEKNALKIFNTFWDAIISSISNTLLWSKVDIFSLVDLLKWSQKSSVILSIDLLSVLYTENTSLEETEKSRYEETHVALSVVLAD